MIMTEGWATDYASFPDPEQTNEPKNKPQKWQKKNLGSKTQEETPKIAEQY